MPEWLYGRHAVEEALKAGRRKVFRVLVSEVGKGQKGQKAGGEQAGRLAAMEAAARKAGVPIERVTAARLDALTRVGHHHQGVAAEVSPFPYASLADVVEMCREAGSEALV